MGKTLFLPLLFPEQHDCSFDAVEHLLARISARRRLLQHHVDELHRPLLCLGGHGVSGALRLQLHSRRDVDQAFSLCVALRYDGDNASMTVAQQYVSRQSQGRGGPSGLADVLDVLLDKGLVIDAFVRVSLVGIELLTVDIRIVVASVDTYLRFAEAVNRLDLYAASNAENVPTMIRGEARSKTSRALGGGRDG